MRLWNTTHTYCEYCLRVSHRKKQNAICLRDPTEKGVKIVEMEKVQEILFDNKDKMPEGVYLDLQNELKNAYEANLRRKTYSMECYHPSTKTKFTSTHTLIKEEFDEIEWNIAKNGKSIYVLGDPTAYNEHIRILFEFLKTDDKEFHVLKIMNINSGMVWIKK